MSSEIERPQRAANVALAGEMPGSAYATPQWLIQRGDRYLQVSELIYRVAELADGTHTCAEIAVLVAAMTRRGVKAADVQALITEKLAPAGVIAPAGANAAAGASPVATEKDKGRSPLAVQLRARLIGPRVID